ncbi:MAG: T9SS type A sorting domain-containing protein [Dyadobacter sp.]
MKKQLLAPFNLFICLSLLTVSPGWAQGNKEFNTALKRQKLELRSELAKSKLQTITKWAEKRRNKLNPVDLKSSKNIYRLLSFNKSFGLTKQKRTRISNSRLAGKTLKSARKTLDVELIPDENGVLYVNKGGYGLKDGSSWENAAAEVADALFASNGNVDILEIWVAGGVYHPLYQLVDLSNDDPKSPLNTFLMVDGVSLYGGFAGTETSRDQRDLSITENESILSGDFDNNDQYNFFEIPDNGPDIGLSENAYRVVSIIGLNNYGTALNGFTVEGAFNNLADEDIDRTDIVNDVEVSAGLGAGIYVQEASPLLENLIIRNNIGLLGGGLTGISSSTVITNSVVYHNIDVVAGSGVLDIGSNGPLVVINTTVAQNLSLTYGPGFGIIISSVAMGNSIVHDNIVTENYPDGDGNLPQADFYAQGSEGFIEHSLIGGSGGSIDWKLVNPDVSVDIEDGGGNLDEDPSFKDIYNADFSLTACSRAIDAGVDSFYEEETLPLKDLVGNPRIFNDVLDMGAFEFQGLQVSVNVGLAGNGKESEFEFTDQNPHTFTAETGVCAVDILTLEPISLTGNVSSKVWFDAQVNSYNNALYLQRHYDIVPDNDAENVTANVTLYFTQAEFDALNSKLKTSEYLPTGESDGEAARIANFRIYQFHGISENGNGKPWSYGDSRVEINPDDNKIVWNAELQRWEVTFEVSGFSGFFGGTASQNPLPVRLISFEGKRTGEQKIKLDWKVVEQVDIATYDIEYSVNGKIFNRIGQIKANMLSSTNYSYTDTLTRSGEQAYYRLKILELDGKTAFSRIIAIEIPVILGMIAYPVPARNDLWIDWKKADDVTVEFVDLNGRILKTVQKQSAYQKVDISGLPSGTLLLKSKKNYILKVVKE